MVDAECRYGIWLLSQCLIILGSGAVCPMLMVASIEVLVGI